METYLEPLIYEIGGKISSERLLLLDRDETIISDEKGYTSKPEDLRILPGVIEGIGYAAANGYAIAVITNQSGIGRGYFTKTQMELFHDVMLKNLSKDLGQISLIVVCPHAPDSKGLPTCHCRKPQTGMLLAAINYFEAKRESTVMIGDKETDLMAANASGIRGVNVKEFIDFLDCCVNVL